MHIKKKHKELSYHQSRALIDTMINKPLPPTLTGQHLFPQHQLPVQTGSPNILTLISAPPSAARPLRPTMQCRIITVGSISLSPDALGCFVSCRRHSSSKQEVAPPTVNELATVPQKERIGVVCFLFNLICGIIQTRSLAID